MKADYQTLIDYEPVGNYHYDSVFLKASIEFVEDSKNPVKQKVEVIENYDNAMGMITPHGTDRRIINSFLRDVRG